MSEVQSIRNEMEMVRRQLQEADGSCHELEELHHTLCVESEQRANAISEIQSKLAQSQGDLNDINALLHEVTDGLKRTQEHDQALLSLGSDQAVEEAMVANILAAVQQRVLGGGGSGAAGGATSGGKSGASNAASAADAVAAMASNSKSKSKIHGPSTLEVKYYREGSSDSFDVANFKVVRNYTFEQLFEDCCRYWDLFPPDIKIQNENNAKWSLEALVEQEWVSTRGAMQVILRHIDEADDDSDVDDLDAGNLDDDGDEVIGDIDLRKQWPPPMNRAKLLRELILYIGLCVVYVVFIRSQRDTEKAFNLQNAISQTFVQGNFGLFNSFTFTSIRTEDELVSFVQNVLVQSLFEEQYINGDTKPLDERGFVLRYNKVIGGVQFKQHRVKESSCSAGHRETQYNVSNAKLTRTLVSDCYFEYSSSTKSIDPFGNDPTIPGFQYIPNLHGESDQGGYGSYPASAFIRNITATPLTTQDEFTAEVNEMLNNGWLDSNTRAVVIQFVFYNGNFNSHIQVKFVIEQTPAGEYQPYGAFVNVFRIFKFEFKASVEIVTFFIIVGYLGYYTVLEVQQAQHCKRVTGSYLPYLKDIWNIIEIFIIWSTCAVVGLFVWLYTNNTATTWTYFRDSYPELGNYVFIQQRLFDLFAINIFLLVFKLFKFFPLNAELNMLWEMLKLAASSLANFLLMLVVLFVGFVVMANMIFGTQLQEFTKLEFGFVYLYLYLLGTFDYQGLTQTDSVWGPVFFSVYMVLFVMIMLNVFLAILNDAYVLVHDRIEAEKIARKPPKKRNFQDYLKLIRRSLAINKRKRKTE